MDVNIAVGLDLAHVLKNRAPQGRTIGRNTLIDEVLQAWGLEIAPSSSSLLSNSAFYTTLGHPQLLL